MLFIVIHQVYELWFKEILHELDHLERPAGAQRRRPRARHAQAHPHHPQGDGRPARHPGDDDPARVPLVPRPAGVRERIPVVPVPGARVRAGLEGREGAGALPGRERGPARGWSGGSSRPRCGTPSCATSPPTACPVPRADLERDVTRRVESSPALREVLIAVYREPAGAGRAVRAAGGSRRRAHGVALPAREDGAAHHRHPRGTGGSAGADYLLGHAQSAAVSGSLGDPHRAVNACPGHGSRVSLRFPQRPRAPLFAIRGVGAAAAHRALAPGLARLRLRRPAGGLARRGALRGRQVGARVRPGRAGPRGVRPAPGRHGRRHRAGGQHPRAGGAAALRAAARGRGPGWSRPTASSTASAASSTAWRRRGSPSCGCPRRRSSRWPRGSAARWTTARRWCWSRPSSSTPDASPAGSPRWRRAAGATGAGCWWTPTTRSTWCRSRSPTRGSATPSSWAAGYKYCQLGEGNCFLRIPPDTDLRPVVTGWFSEFTVLADRPARGAGGLRAGRRPVRRRDLRSDQPLSRRRRCSTSSASRGSRPSCCGR